MDSEKKRAPWVPALIEPPDPLAPLEEWQSYRADLDLLEARLLVSHPDLDWLDGIRAFKAEADARIARHRAAGESPADRLAERSGGSARRSGARPAHGHQMHELGSIDVMRLDQTLGPVASRCLRIKLYVDENLP
jgi:hypothetical protein